MHGFETKRLTAATRSHVLLWKRLNVEVRTKPRPRLRPTIVDKEEKKEKVGGRVSGWQHLNEK